MLKFGKLTINKASLSSMDRGAFISLFTGKLNIDINEALKIVEPYLKKEIIQDAEPIISSSFKRKSTKR